MLECMEESLKEEELKKVKKEHDNDEEQQEFTRFHDSYGFQQGFRFLTNGFCIVESARGALFSVIRKQLLTFMLTINSPKFGTLDGF